MSGPYIWKPSAAVVKNANVTKFMERHEIRTYEELIQRCTTGIEWFWDSCVHETNIDWFEPYTQLLDGTAGIADSKWFVGGRINITHNCVDRYAQDKKHAKKVAVVWQGECGAVVKLTYGELYEQVNQVANYLKEVGVERGDAVATYMPMLPQLLPVFFAALKIGAVLVPVFSGFGTDAVVARFESARVKVVFTADGSLRRGQPIALKESLQSTLKKCPFIESCVVVKRLHLEDVPMKKGRDVFYDDVIAGQPVGCDTEELPSEHKSLIIYTSGTTGKPKGTVHTHAGVLAQVAKEFFFHFDAKPKDVFFWFTDIGWMMGPWEIIGTLHFGNTLVLVEGAPNHPKPHRLLKLCDDFGVTHFGVSPTLIRLLMREKISFARFKLNKLRMMGSTAEPWDEDSYKWCFEKIGKSKAPIMNISGGTEIMGCLLAPLPIQPLKACSLQGPGLGMCVDVFTEGGYPAGAGEVGYLVCRKPAPSMTKGFLHDRERYHDTYFSKFKNVWNHGDWAVRDADGQWFLRGRADDTIKIAGKRTGPSEIESCLCDQPFINEACAIGVPDELKGEALVCFVVLKQGIAATKFLTSHLRDWVAQHLGKTLKPKSIYFVDSLPKTRSGKIVRGVIKKHHLGQKVGDLASVENIAALQAIPTAA